MIALLFHVYTLLAVANSTLGAAGSLVQQDSTKTVVFGIMAAAAFGVLGAMASVVQIWDRLRTKPAMHTVYATKAELAAMEARITEDLKAVFEKLDTLQRTFTAFSNDVWRALGKLEGADKGKR